MTPYKRQKWHLFGKGYLIAHDDFTRFTAEIRGSVAKAGELSSKSFAAYDAWLVLQLSTPERYKMPLAAALIPDNAGECEETEEELLKRSKVYIPTLRSKVSHRSCPTEKHAEVAMARYFSEDEHDLEVKEIFCRLTGIKASALTWSTQNLDGLYNGIF